MSIVRLTICATTLAAACGAPAGSPADAPAAIDAIGVPDAARFDARPSSGCGTPHAAGLSPPRSLDVLQPDGSHATRTYKVRVPAGYDPATPGPLAFGFPGTDGTPDSIDSRGVWQVAPALLYVYPQPTEPVPSYPQCQPPLTCWDLRSDGDDMAFVTQLLAAIDADYCVDGARVTAFGFSSGAIFSDLLACRRQDVVHGVALIEGLEPFVEAPPTFSACGAAAVPYFQKENDGDPVVTLGDAQASRDFWIAHDGCAATTTPWPPDPSACVQYDGCRAPVVWCEHAGGGHTWDAPEDSEDVAAFLPR